MLKLSLSICALFTGLVSVLATTTAFAVTTADFRAYGFASETEMKNYFTISSSETVSSKAPKSQKYDIVVISPDFGRQLDGLVPAATATPTPAPTSTPATGSVLIPGQPAPGQSPAPGQMPNVPNFPGSRPGMVPGVSTGNAAIDILLNPALVDSWVTIGMKVWAIIASNRPVANVSTQRISVLPSANIDWIQMENWKGPAARTYTIKKKNMYGMTVVENTYTIAYNYGGQVNGVGAFLANATIIPTAVNVIFGFTLDADAQVGQPVNISSQANPVAGVDIQVRYKVTTFINHSQGVDAFFLSGDGQIKQLNESESVRLR